MEIVFWGVRGSCPVSGPEYIKAGGHTSCVSVYTKRGDLYVFDAGSGLIDLGKWIAAHNIAKARLFLTHLHLDHLMGLPFLGPIWTPEFSLELFSTQYDLKGFLAKHLFHHPLFPVEFGQLPSNIDNRAVVPGEVLRFGEDSISMVALSHPGGSIGYRLDTPEGSFAYLTDTENEEGVLDQNQLDLVKGVNCLVYDATFNQFEYMAKRGWGHSTHLQAARLAKEAGVQKLALFHHDPAHTDAIIDDMVLEAQKIFPQTFAALQGLRVEVNN